MLGKVKTMLSRLNTNTDAGDYGAGSGDQTSVRGDGGTAGKTTTGGSDTTSPPYLYSCPSCDKVYVGVDKQTCSSCEMAVDRVE